MKQPLYGAALAGVLFTVAVAAVAVIGLRASGTGDEVGDFLFGLGGSEPTPTKTPLPAPTVTVLPQLTASEAEQLAENWLLSNPFTDQTEDVLYAECHEQELNSTTSQWILACGINYPSDQAPPFTVRVDSVTGEVETVR